MAPMPNEKYGLQCWWGFQIVDRDSVFITQLATSTDMEDRIGLNPGGDDEPNFVFEDETMDDCHLAVSVVGSEDSVDFEADVDLEIVDAHYRLLFPGQLNHRTLSIS